MPSNHLILCHPLSSPFPSAFNLSQQKGFSNELALCIRWPKYWSFSISISPSNEYSGLISIRIDWFDLLAVQGTLKSLLQHHNSKASVLQQSAFFMVQLSLSYMTTGETLAFTKSQGRRSLVGCSPLGRKESDKTKRFHFHFSLSCIGEGNGNPLQCSCLENPRDGEAWRAAVYGVAQGRIRLT